MSDPLHARFSRLERQIMDAVYALGEATVAEVVSRIGDPSSHDSVRVTMGILEKKGFLEHRVEDQRNVYSPTVPTEKARRSAMEHLLGTFFEGSPTRAILAFLDMSGERLSPEEMDEIAELIEEAGEGSGESGEES